MKKHTTIPKIQGESFRKAREEQGLSVADLADKATLSKNQIEQIENGGVKSFYSEAIKFQSAKKVAKILELTDEEAFVADQEIQTQQTSLLFTEIEKPEPELLLEIEPEINFVSKVESKNVIEVEKESSATLENTTVMTTYTEEAIATTKADINNDRHHKISYVKFLSYLGSAVALILLIAHYNYPLQVEKPNPPVAEDLVMEGQGLKQAEDRKEIELVEESAKAQPEQTIATKEAPKVEAKVISTLSECSGLFSNPEKYTPTLASKIGNQVYVQSKTESTICFEDADGNQQKRDLAQNAGTSFYGKSPFKLGSNNLEQFDIFFQGYKVKADFSKKSIILTEQTPN